MKDRLDISAITATSSPRDVNQALIRLMEWANTVRLKIPDGAAKGNMMVWDGSKWTVVPNGTGVLTNDGAGNLSWV